MKIKTEPVGAMPAATAMPIDSDIDEIDGDGDDDSDIRNTPWDDIDGWDLELVDDVDEAAGDGPVERRHLRDHRGSGV